jgi:glycosyltransferase involved in cell wall biosynthesis
MYKGQSVAVVITAYNEAGFVGTVIETLPSFVDRAYVVDDASTDDTWAEIERHAVATDGGRVTSSTDGAVLDESSPVEDVADQSNGVEEVVDENGESAGTEPRKRTQAAEADVSAGETLVVPIRHETNRGVGAAVVTGYRRAYADGMDVVAVMNGDGQMDPDILDRILDPVVEGRADYAKGNRLLSREHTHGMGAWRRFGNGCLTLLTKAASGYWKTMDPQNGYTAISREALGALDLDELYEGYGFLNDLLVALNTRGMRVADVEMQALYADEESSIAYSSFIPRVSRLLLSGFLRRLRIRYLVYDFHPLVGLYALGALGPVAGLCQVALLAASGIAPARALASLVPVVLVSGVALVLAMTLDAMASEHLESQELRDGTTSPRRRSAGVGLTDGGE